VYLAEACLIYQAGGKFLALAPQGYGPLLADLVERMYAAETLTAQSVAVSEDVALISLRYGRQPLRYWVEHFLDDWHAATPNAALTSAEREQRSALAAYYAPQNIWRAGDVADFRLLSPTPGAYKRWRPAAPAA
jgi:hypothetical protein